MVICTVEVNEKSPQTIVIGRRGTYNTQEVVFDIGYLIDAYGAGTAVLAVKRSQDSSAYPAVVAQEDSTVTWTISETDTYYKGAGECELMWYVDGGLAKTIIYPMVVMRDILSTTEEAPDAYQTWVDDLTALGAETLQNAQDAAQSASDAESAKDDAVTAKEAAEEAAETAQEAVVHAPIIQNGYWYTWNDGQYVDTGVRAEGQKGDKGDTGEKGDTGNGIASITKTGTAGLVDTYTVTYTDGTTTTFTVTNGAKGDKGDTGATGNGIQSITKTGTSGNVDTYTITYTNGQTTTFTVTNGAVSSVAGKTGAVTLDANDVAFSESGTYDDGTLGAEVSAQKNAISDEYKIINDAIGYRFPLVFTMGKYLYKNTGKPLSDAYCAMTMPYYRVFAGQKLKVNLVANSSDVAICFYDTNQVYTFNSSSWVGISSAQTRPVEVVVPFDGYARFGTDIRYVSTTDAYVENVGSYTEDIDSLTVRVDSLEDTPDVGYYPAGDYVPEGTAYNFKPSTPKIEHKYTGNVTPDSKFLCISFDDLRTSDISMVVPMLNKYNITAGFNKVQYGDVATDGMLKQLNQVVFCGGEIGDHTFRHDASPYTDPLFNGQNPSNPDGNQTPFPTNDQLRQDVGDGKNVFGRLLTQTATGMTVSWGSMTDAQCQEFREKYALLTSETGTLLDTLSNKYLGTTGISKGSWDSVEGCYTGGIFTGCKTSCNHEVWERITEITEILYKDQYKLNQKIRVWSKPGSSSPSLRFGGYYYNQSETLRANFLAKFTSSLYKNNDGTYKSRSFMDVLVEHGYVMSSDFDYPSRFDGLPRKAMKEATLEVNSQQAFPNGIMFPSYATMPISYDLVSTSYPDTYFTGTTSNAAQMYDTDGCFRTFIEALRKRTANGLIAAFHADSTDNYSSRVFFDELFKFCEKVGIEIINPSQAHDICFNHPLMNGNLIYNRFFENSVAKGIPDATNVPNNPDGYTGSNLSVSVTDSGEKVLNCIGSGVYLQYGIPYGSLKYSCDCKGNGTIYIYGIKNSSPPDLSMGDLTLFAQINSNSADDFVSKEATFVVPKNALTSFEQQYAGYGDRYNGIKILYTAGISVKNICLELLS